MAFRITKARPSRAAFAASVVTGVALLVGSSASAATVKPDKVTTSTSGGCGTVPYVAPDAPNHVLSTLPKAYAASYTGFTDYPIVKSAWANWKPKKKSGFNVQIVWLPENNPVDNAELDAVVGALQASGKVKTIQVQQPSSDTDVAGQLQELQTAIDRKPNLIIAIPISPTAAAPLVDQAGKEGIPTVVPSIGLPGPYDVSVYTNVYLSVAAATADVARDAGGTGSFLAVAGVPGVPNTVDAVNAWTDVLKRAPISRSPVRSTATTRAPPPKARYSSSSGRIRLRSRASSRLERWGQESSRRTPRPGIPRRRWLTPAQTRGHSTTGIPTPVTRGRLSCSRLVLEEPRPQMLRCGCSPVTA